MIERRSSAFRANPTFVIKFITPLGYWNVMDLVARLRDRTDVMFTPHLFRHTYATDLLHRDVPSEVVQKPRGHASVSTTIDTYAHLEIEHIRAALRAAGWLPEAAAAHEAERLDDGPDGIGTTSEQSRRRWHRCTVHDAARSRPSLRRGCDHIRPPTWPKARSGSAR